MKVANLFFLKKQASLYLKSVNALHQRCFMETRFDQRLVLEINLTNITTKTQTQIAAHQLPLYFQRKVFMPQYIKTRKITFDEALKLSKSIREFEPFPVLSEHGIRKIKAFVTALLGSQNFDLGEVLMSCEEDAKVLLTQKSHTVTIQIGEKSKALQLDRLDFDWLVESESHKKYASNIF